MHAYMAYILPVGLLPLALTTSRKPMGQKDPVVTVVVSRLKMIRNYRRQGGGEKGARVGGAVKESFVHSIVHNERRTKRKQFPAAYASKPWGKFYAGALAHGVSDRCCCFWCNVRPSWNVEGHRLSIPSTM